MKNINEMPAMRLAIWAEEALPLPRCPVPVRCETRRYLPQQRREEFETFLSPGEVCWLLELSAADCFAFRRIH